MTAILLSTGDKMLTDDPSAETTLPVVLPRRDSVDRRLHLERTHLAQALQQTLVSSLADVEAQAVQAQVALRAGDVMGALHDLTILRDLAAHGREEAHRAILGLRPAALVGHDLAGALGAEVARIAGGAGLRHQFTLSGSPAALSPAVEDGLLRITQEALHNVRRYATAGRVEVRLEYDAGVRRVCLTVEDDGQGFDRRHPLAGGLIAAPDDPDAPALHAHPAGADGPSGAYDDDVTAFGLLSMQERARLLGGELRVAAGRGMGTVVEVEVPYSAEAAPLLFSRPTSAAPRPAAVTVVIATDQPLARAGIRHLLTADANISVVAEAADGVSALAEVNALRPAVLLLDLQSAETDSVAVLARLQMLQAAGGHVPATVVLTTYDEDTRLLAALRAGAQGYVLKQAEGSELVRTVRAAARGESLLPPGLAARLLRQLVAPPAVETLTPREADVLRLLADGLGTKAIATQLGLGPGTVKSHLEHLYQKLRVVGQGRGAALAAARAAGLL
ncbi:MAG TPA: LuxR C-terminal-related transcriptional regulator [Chloroflexia bacterium]|nr:LuxR C-terminal-related transcriptional regulator [Chloroflexia bacterium]